MQFPLSQVNRSPKQVRPSDLQYSGGSSDPSPQSSSPSQYHVAGTHRWFGHLHKLHLFILFIFGPFSDDYAQHSLNVCEPQCWGLLTFHYHPFLSMLLTFHSLVQWTGMIPHGWQVSFPHISQILSLKKTDCFCALWNETLFQSPNVFYASKTDHILLEVNCPHTSDTLTL
jgi:hypothetical protein